MPQTATATLKWDGLDGMGWVRPPNAPLLRAPTVLITVFMFESKLDFNRNSNSDDDLDGSSDGMIVSRTSSKRWSVKAVEFAGFLFTLIEISNGETISRRVSSFVVSPNTTSLSFILVKISLSSHQFALKFHFHINYVTTSQGF